MTFAFCILGKFVRCRMTQKSLASVQFQQKLGLHGMVFNLLCRRFQIDTGIVCNVRIFPLYAPRRQPAINRSLRWT